MTPDGRTLFLDLRMHPVGGALTTTDPVLATGTTLADYQMGISSDEFFSNIAGRHVLLVAHGFNDDRAFGIEHLHNWETLLQLPAPYAFVGILWPGDSTWAHGLDYPEEPKVANHGGRKLGPFIDKNFSGAASLSFASHSLGARLVLEAVASMNTPVRRLIMMAPAIDDNCLVKEFKEAVDKKVGSISVLASRKDEVLSALFPLGNFLGGILTVGHPWWHAALGHTGPVQPYPDNFAPPFQLPDDFNFGHGDYLRVTPPPMIPKMSVPQTFPPPLPQPVPPTGAGWHEQFSAAFVSTRFSD